MARMMSRRHVLTGLGVVGLGGVARSAIAQDPVPPPSLCPAVDVWRPGTVGLLRHQIARLSVVGDPVPTEDPNNPAGIAIPPFAVAEIIGADGIALASMKVAQLLPNEAQFLDFEHPVEKTAGGRNEKTAGGRIELFGLVRFTPGHEIGSSLQIVDSQSGETAWAASVASLADPTLGGQGGNPTPAGHQLTGTVGFVRNQILRVSIVHYEHPCFLDVHIVADVIDAQGQLLASKKFGNVKANSAVFLDLPHPGGKGPRRDTRLEVSVHVRFTPGHLVGGTVQVLDPDTGLTTGGTVTPCLMEDPTLTS